MLHVSILYSPRKSVIEVKLPAKLLETEKR